MSIFTKRVRCPYCGSEHVNIQAIQETKRTGCLTWIFVIILAVTVVGLIFVIPFLFSSHKTVTVAVCQQCGSRWNVK